MEDLGGFQGKLERSMFIPRNKMCKRFSEKNNTPQYSYAEAVCMIAMNLQNWSGLDFQLNLLSAETPTGNIRWRLILLFLVNVVV